MNLTTSGDLKKITNEWLSPLVTVNSSLTTVNNKFVTSFDHVPYDDRRIGQREYRRAPGESPPGRAWQRKHGRLNG